MDIKQQSGFSTGLGIVVVIIIIICGALGYALMNQFNKQPVDTSNDATDQTSTETGATKYLKIKEWGVEFALTTATADAYYDTTTLSSHDSMSLRSHSLDSETNCTTKPQSVATIFRVPATAEDESLPGKKYTDTQDGKIIGNYFYFIQGAQDSCVSDGIDKKIILQGVLNSFITAGPTIRAASS